MSDDSPNSNALAVRDPRGRFIPGVSGNVAGRPKINVDVIALARQHTPAAIATLAALMHDPEQSGAVRTQCAVALLNRAHGTPPQSVPVAVDDVQRSADIAAVLSELRGMSFRKDTAIVVESVEAGDAED